MSTFPKVAVSDLSYPQSPFRDAAHAANSWAAIPHMRASLELVEDVLCETLRSDPSATVRRVSLHLVEAGGKRLRPALLLLSGHAAGGNPTGMAKLAAAVEMLHVATLYQDDVIDGALTRRGRPSANAVWGDRVSAMAGTYLIARAMEIFAGSGDRILAAVNESVNQVWHGQMRELEGVYHADRTEEAYFESIAQKTAAFYQLPCTLGAIAAGAGTPIIAALTSFGKFMGMAFQMIDDVLDLVAGEDAIGKPAGGDIRAGVYTLPVIRNVAGNTRLRALLACDSLSADSHREVMELVRMSGEIERALDCAGDFVDQAIAQLDRLPGSDSVEALCATARSIIDRPEIQSWQERRHYEATV